MGKCFCIYGFLLEEEDFHSPSPLIAGWKNQDNPFSNDPLEACLSPVLAGRGLATFSRQVCLLERIFRLIASYEIFERLPSDPHSAYPTDKTSPNL